MSGKEEGEDIPPPGNHSDNSVSDEKQEVANAETARHWLTANDQEAAKASANTKLKNPLFGLSKAELFEDVEAFAKEKNLEHIIDDLKKCALIAQSPASYESLSELSEHEKELIRREKTHRWSQPFMMYFMTSKFSSCGI
jgi:hypothetical protein